MAIPDQLSKRSAAVLGYFYSWIRELGLTSIVIGVVVW